MATVQLNGSPYAILDGETIASLLCRLDLTSPHVAVELNRDVVPRARFAEVKLQDGDRVEVVQFVGGG
jgi:sulfur carrier protein